MKYNFMKISRKYFFYGVFSFLQILLSVNAPAQNSSATPFKRTRENFDFNGQFHKGDITMKLAVRVGQGGITDINVYSTPMPPMTNVPKDEVTKIATWIKSLNK